MANHESQGIDAENGRSQPYWVDPFPTVERVDPSVSPLLAAIAAVPELEVQRLVDQAIAARRAALGW